MLVLIYLETLWSNAVHILSPLFCCTLPLHRCSHPHLAPPHSGRQSEQANPAALDFTSISYTKLTETLREKKVKVSEAGTPAKNLLNLGTLRDYVSLPGTRKIPPLCTQSTVPRRLSFRCLSLSTLLIEILIPTPQP